VSSIKEYFEYYDALDYEEWCELLPDIREETRIYKEVAQTLLEMHEVLMTSLKKREDDAKIIMTEFEDLQITFEEQKKILDASAESRMKWAFALLFVPGVNLIAYPLLTSLAREDTVKAIAKGGQAKVHEAAVIVVAETLIPALSNFIDGLKKTAGFFEAMEKDMQSFEGKAETNIDSPKRLHYKVMRKKANEMKSLCQAFYAALPDVRTDFAAIPNKGTDQNYVDKWLKKELAQIEKKRSTVQRYLLAVFKGSEAGGEAKGDEKSKDGEKAEDKKKYEDKESSEAEGGEKADGDEKSKDGEKDEDKKKSEDEESSEAEGGEKADGDEKSKDGEKDEDKKKYEDEESSEAEGGEKADGDEKSKDGEKDEDKKKYEDEESSEAEGGEKADGDEKSKDGEKDEDKKKYEDEESSEAEGGEKADGDEKSKDGEKDEDKKKYEDEESSEAEGGEKADGDEKSKGGEKDEDEGKLKLKQTNDTFYLGGILRYFRCTLV
jgi:hypothetical protein